MYEDTVVSFSHPDKISITDPLTEVLRAGARRLLAEAVEVEVGAFIGEHADLSDDGGRRRRAPWLPAGALGADRDRPGRRSPTSGP